MYQRFKDCLLRPRNIADYIKEPKKKTVIYTTILLVVYIIPFILISLLSKTAATNLSSSVADDFINAEQINYVIEDGKLKGTTDNVLPQYIKTEIILEQAYALNALYVFDVTGEGFKDVLDVDPGTYIVFLFTEDEFKICRINVSKTADNDNNPGVTISLGGLNNNNSKSDSTYISLTYNELGINDIDLAGNKDNNTINFKNEVAILVTSIYDSIKMKLLPLIIIAVLVLAVSSYFLSILLIAALTKLLYRYLQVDFGIVFKTTILSSTPYVLCSLLAILTNLTILEIVGQFLMIVYVTRALTVYKIKYDGGVPLPRYMQNMMGEKEDEEKGSDDDEL